MLLLAFDTATPAVTVALHDGERVLAERTTVDARRQGELLAPHIAEALAAAGAGTDRPDGVVAVGVGPGPFTGLRVGVVTALVMGAALGIQVVGVCTLDVLAAEAVLRGAVRDSFLVATDARRREVHWAAYERRRTAGRSAPRAPRGRGAGRRRAVDGRPVVGRGADLYAEVLGPRVGPVDPSAAVLAVVRRRGARRRTPSAEPPYPLYLRRPDAVVPGPPKPVRS